VAKDSGALTRVADQRAKKVKQTLKNNNIDWQLCPWGWNPATMFWPWKCTDLEPIIPPGQGRITEANFLNMVALMWEKIGYCLQFPASNGQMWEKEGKNCNSKNDIKSSKEIVVEYSYSCLFCDTQRVWTFKKKKSSYVGGQTITICNVPCCNTRKTTLLPYIYIINCWIEWMDKKAFKYLKLSILLQNEIWIVYCIFIFHYYYFSSIILFQNIDQSHFFWKGLRARIGC
jgi:hypothetical protein